MHPSKHLHAGLATLASLVLAGAALADGTWLGSSYCQATPNSSGLPAKVAMFGPDHFGSGLVYMNDSVVLSAGPVPKGAVGMFIYGQVANQVPFGEGFLCISAPIKRLPVTAAHGVGSGLFGQSISFIDHPGFAPGEWKLQCWFRDPLGGPAGFNLSDGLTFTISS